MRIEPVQPPYEPELEERLRTWMPPGTEGIEPLVLFRTFARHPGLMSRMLPLGAGILGPSARVPQRQREVMIHRTSALTGATYEWGVHAVGFAKAVGFTDEQLASTATGSSSDACWDALDATVFALADELHATSTVSGDVFSRLRRHFEDDQIIELVVTAGWYHVIAYVINATEMEPEPWAMAFPGG